MSSLLSCYELEKSFGGPPLFSRIALNVMPGEKIGVLGPNGAGKSTLLRILAGMESADSGDIIRKNGLRLAYLHQKESFEPDQTVLDYLIASLAQDHSSEEEQWSRIGTVTNALG